MSPRPLTAATLLFLAGCGEADHGHDHDPSNGHEHAPAPPAAPAAPVAAAAAPLAPPDGFALGAWSARLELTAEGLRLVATDAGGASVAPSGEVRVVLTGTGEAEQRVVLMPAEGGWAGAAKAAGAPGYVAVVSAEVDGHAESARVTWGEVPVAAPAPKAEEPPHDHAVEQGDAHGHAH